MNISRSFASYAPRTSQRSRASTTRFLTPGVNCSRKRERSGRCRTSAARLGSAGGGGQPLDAKTPLYAPGCPFHNPVERSCACLFDHLIRLEEDRRGNGEAEGLRSLEVDHQLEFDGLLHRQV